MPGVVEAPAGVPLTSASEPLRRFLQAARGAGLRVSAAEGIDAVRALDVVGYSDRAVLKDTLGLVLAKTPDEKALYHEAFDLYFKHEALSADKDGENAPGGDVNSPPQGSGNALSQLLTEDDRAGLATAMEAAGRESGIENIRFFTQKNLYTRRILVHMGLHAVEDEVEALRTGETQLGMDRAALLESRVARLRDTVRDFVERNMLLFARGENEQYREALLKSARLSNLERRDMERLRVLVRQMAKKLAARYAKTRRRRLRGHLDVRLTLRKNMGWGGIPFVTVWKQKRIEKPRVMVLCDVSGSVAAMSQFLLMFLYALNEALSDIRAFAYSGSLIEVSDILEKEPVEQAIHRIMDVIGFGSSNYGNALADFEDGWMEFVTNKTTVIILGDARGNHNDPRIDILARLSQRSRRIIWLNPEYRTMWGTGDSDMRRYAPFCNVVTECSTLRHLERAISDVLEGAN
ncbi:MAG: VWA domain-containing protein [Burkholderiales bacterium]